MPRKEDEAQSTHDEGSDSDNVMLMTTTNLEGDNSNLWYLDISYSNHKTKQIVLRVGNIEHIIDEGSLSISSLNHHLVNTFCSYDNIVTN